MALITTNTSLKIGFDQRFFTSGNTSTINSTTVGVALPFLAQFTGSITRVVLTAVINTNYTNLNVGIMGSNATGDLPSDTYLATPNVQSGSTNSIPTNYIINLTNSVSVVKGQVYWLVFRPLGTFTGTLQVYYNHFLGLVSYNGQYRTALRTASTWSRNTTIGSIAMVGSSTKWYSVDAAYVPDSTTVISPAANQEYGFAFTLDANHPAIRVKGISFANSLNNSAGNGNPGMSFICKIYNAAGTLLYTFDTQDTDRINTTTGNGNAYFFNSSGSDIWLEPGTKYYIMQAFSGTFTNTPQYSTNLYDNTVQTALGAYNANYAQRSSGGVITETTTQFFIFHLEVDGIRFDDAGGGAGGYVNASPMFSGGFSG
jgi:hypothetical protein